MIKRMWHWLIDTLTPRWIKREVEQAEAAVEEQRRVLNDVAEKTVVVNKLVRAHEQDRNRNHYGERIAAALGGYPWN